MGASQNKDILKMNKIFRQLYLFKCAGLNALDLEFLSESFTDKITSHVAWWARLSDHSFASWRWTKTWYYIQKLYLSKMSWILKRGDLPFFGLGYSSKFKIIDVKCGEKKKTFRKTQFDIGTLAYDSLSDCCWSQIILYLMNKLY